MRVPIYERHIDMISKKPKGLGRGLEALLGGGAPDLSPEATKVTPSTATLPVSALRAGKYQPRTRMDEGALNELADSIRAQGLLQALLVRPIAGDPTGATHEIIAGERRFRAAQLAGLTDVPVMIKDVDDQAAAAMALIENMQREDLNPLEEALGIQRLIKEFQFTHEQAADAVGRSRSAVSNLLRLLNLAKPVQAMLMAGGIDMGHARALLAVDPATQITLGNEIIAQGLSVRETEKRVVRATTGKSGVPAAAREKSRDLVRLEEELSDALATTVSIKANARNKGELVIAFANLDQLDGVIARLRQQ